MIKTNEIILALKEEKRRGKKNKTILEYFST